MTRASKTVTGIHEAVRAIQSAGWDAVRDNNGEESLVCDLDATDEGDATEYVVNGDTVEQLRDGYRAGIIWTRVDHDI